MGSDTPRAIVLAAASARPGLSPAAVVASADGSPHAVEPLNEAERAGLLRSCLADTPASVLGDFPDWLEPSFERAFGAAPPTKGRRWRAARPSICGSTR